ncbi:TIGR00730 family Rossman fold protein [Campylobacter sp.]|uniref:LOG family protein n=1 Tax=Campylobacter sp. TaxID=205 RepID=UPI0026DB8D6F|nr:TIGR00730 family Rossman fold protein [Campylobacter sp.]MDO4674781.1 TIGR00730 family Rossman fold protein [Campylobacter sp.]
MSLNIVRKDLENFAKIPDLKNPVTFFGSARLESDNFYYQQAKILAKRCVEEGFCVISGGGGGIMRAANEGACGSGGDFIHSVGLNILLPYEQKLNEFVEYGITFESLAIRKMALIEKSLAFVIFPGGFGTLDELLEILTLKQLAFKKDIPILLYGEDFWQGFDAFIKNSLLRHEVISKGDELKYQITDDLELMMKILKGQ